MAEDSKVLQVENPNPETVGYQPAVQSANTLFHFEKKSEYLFSIIEKMAIVPRYCVEDIDYLDIGIEEIAYPMLCFCDINLHKIQEHMNFYDQYGIAFSKQWGISRGIQPIQYVNPNSILRHDFTEAFQASMDAPEESAAQNYLQSHMYYLKPIQGTMQRDGKSVLKNFTDECEWRFIPNVSKENLPQAITQAEIFSRSRLNETIAICENCWLKFNAEDIKYIILQTHDEFEKVVAMIAEKALSSKVKSWLMSKILVWPEVKGDF